MRQLSTLTLLIFLGFNATLTAQRSAHRFIDHFKNENKCIAMTIPGYMIRTGFNFASKFSDDNKEQKIYKSLGKHFKKMRFMVIEEDSNITNSNVADLLTDLRESDRLEEYVKVRDNDTRVTVFMNEADEIIKDLVLVIKGDEEFALVIFKTDLPLNLLKEAKFSFNDN